MLSRNGELGDGNTSTKRERVSRPRNNAQSIDSLACASCLYHQLRGYSFGPSVRETEREKVGVLNRKPQPHGPSGELADVGRAVPGDGTLQVVAVDIVTLVHREARYGTPAFILDLNTYISRGGGGEVER